MRKNIMLRESPIEYLEAKYQESVERAERWTTKRIAFEDRHPNEINRIYALIPVVGALLVGAGLWGLK